MEVKAQAKYLRGSAQKARLVADAVRGKKATYALEVLKYMRKAAAPEVRKVVQSALANAVNNFNLDPETLVVSQIMVDEAPMFKRGRAESKGRYRKILKRNNHVTVVLAEVNMAPAQPETAPKAKKAAKAKAEPVAKKPATRAKKAAKVEAEATETAAE
jgi:large subunit ribosomal protein L22